MRSIRVGTSGWSYKDWSGPFYTADAAPGDFLAQYAEQFDIVEVDSTYYRIPSPTMVAGWARKTPDDFRFAVKTPGVITHEKMLHDCDSERDEFLAALEPLGDKLHSILLQFSYFNKNKFSSPEMFFDRLEHFLDTFPGAERLAVEIRNKSWLVDDFFNLLRRHKVSYALTEHVWMPPMEQVVRSHDCLTGRLLYLRLIGDRNGIEKITTSWDRVVVDRTERMQVVAHALADVISQSDVVVFINNHYAGHGPASAREFIKALDKEGVTAG